MKVQGISELLCAMLVRVVAALVLLYAVDEAIDRTLPASKARQYDPRLQQVCDLKSRNERLLQFHWQMSMMMLMKS